MQDLEKELKEIEKMLPYITAPDAKDYWTNKAYEIRKQLQKKE